MLSAERKSTSRTHAKDALFASRANKGSKWSSRPDNQRLEPICSLISKPGFKLQLGEPIFTDDDVLLANTYSKSVLRVVAQEATHQIVSENMTRMLFSYC